MSEKRSVFPTSLRFFDSGGAGPALAVGEDEEKFGFARHCTVDQCSA